MTIGQRIRRLRKERDWTQQELGEKAGVNFRNLPRYESGRLEPGIKVLHRFADAFEVPVEELLGSEQLPPARSGLKDLELYRLVFEIDRMSEDDRQAVKQILHAVVFKHQVQSLGQTA